MTEQSNPQVDDAAGNVAPDEDLLQLLVCPADHAHLNFESETLICTVCGRRYPIEDGVPNMLLEDA